MAKFIEQKDADFIQQTLGSPKKFEDTILSMAKGHYVMDMMKFEIYLHDNPDSWYDKYKDGSMKRATYALFGKAKAERIMRLMGLKT